MKKGKVAIEEIEPYNNKTFRHIWKWKFDYFDDSNDNTNGNSDGDSNDDSNGEKFDAIKFHGDASGLNDIDGYYYDCHDDYGDGIDDINDKIDVKNFIAIMQDLVILMMITMIFMMNLIRLIIMTRNSLVWDFMVSAKIMEEFVFTAIIKTNKRAVHSIYSLRNKIPKKCSGSI